MHSNCWKEASLDVSLLQGFAITAREHTVSDTRLCKKVCWCFMLLAGFLPMYASAYQGYHIAKVEQIILDGSLYNGCMVKVIPDLPAEYGCPRKDFVSLDCDGVSINTKSFANQMLQTAQISLLVDKTIRLRVTDSILVNENFCIADYIRLNKSE